MNYLAVELSEIAVRFSALSGSVQSQKEFIFADSTDIGYKEQMTNFLELSGFRQQSFDEYTISWSSFRTTLVPSNVFNETKPDKIFTLCFGSEISKSNVDYNRIPEHGIVNVYDVPLWVKSFFISTYPRSIIQHEGTHFLRGLFLSKKSRLSVNILIHHNYFLLVVVDANKLQFYSTFEYTTLEDVLYYLMFTFQQKNYLNTELFIRICPSFSSDKSITIQLKQHLTKLQELDKATVEIDEEFVTQSLKLCVL